MAPSLQRLLLTYLSSAALVASAGAWTAAQAQTRVEFAGSVVDADGLALPGATVDILSADQGHVVTTTVTDGAGVFAFADLAPGSYRVTARLSGFERFEERVDLAQSRTDFRIALRVGRFEQQFVVTAQMPEVSLDITIPGAQLERGAARDVAAYLRNEPGVNAVRRGAINLEPTVRGLYEAQMGVFVDGTRTFAAGPARMDSEISHVSPHVLQSLEVVKGPYALTQGSGTLSSIRATTFRPAFSGATLGVHGRGSYNFAGNGNASDGFGGIWGASDRLRFTVFHNTRVGHDYRDGAGGLVPGGYQSYETRWDFGVRPRTNLLIEYSGGYQDQQHLDYPGRILDATFVKTNSHAVEASWRPAGSAVTEVFGQVYANLKDHLMNNDKKPTGQPMAGRIPPFALRIDLPTSSNTVGGRGYVSWRSGRWEGKVGGDLYQLRQDATRSISRRDTGALLFSDIVWPDAKLTNGGGYGQVVFSRGVARVGGTVRADTFHASAGQASDFFLATAGSDLEAQEAALSAAVNASVIMNPHWMLTLGAGRAVRAPDALERYSDRFPAAQFQVAAEFLGNPQLRTEKSLEFNAGTIVDLPGASVRADVFRRVIDDYITVRPDPAVPKRLPLSPPIVYRYVNGTRATYAGFEASTTAAAGPYAAVRANWSYLRATDETYDEPLFGIAPFQQRYALELHTAGRGSWVELEATNTADQNRVATTRLEAPTPGWTRLDLRGGLALPGGLSLRSGIENLANATYTEHLNAPNPFTGMRVLERGRSGYVGLEYTF